MEEKGWVVSVTGGVALATQITGEPSHADKRGMMVEEKSAIAKLAETLIGDASTLYLDAGTTTLALARRIAETGRDCEKMLFVTNDLVIGSYITENIRCRLYFVGGMVDTENRSCVGDGAASPLRQLNIDVAFLSTPSWNMRWLSIPDQDKSIVKKAVVESSARRYLVSDSSKYGKVGAFKSVPLASFDGVVTDAALPDKTREALTQQGIGVLIA
jgi:DeoR/GlpR family transcriptional regulator of sugar metabolism